MSTSKAGVTFVTTRGAQAGSTLGVGAIPPPVLQHQVAYSLDRVRIPRNPTIEDLVRVLTALEDQILDATQAARSLPYGAMQSYFKDVSFTSGDQFIFNHGLKASPRFMLVNKRVAVGDCFVPNDSNGNPLASSTTITLQASATFTADVWFYQVP